MAGYETPAAFLRRMAPAQSHDGRREFIAAADLLDVDEARDLVDDRVRAMKMQTERIAHPLRRWASDPDPDHREEE